MREKMILLWRKITKIKILFPFIISIRYFAGTNFFNMVLDFLEVKILHTSYKQTVRFMIQNEMRIKKAVNSLSDEKSCKVYQNIWKYRATHDRRYLKGIVDKEQYFDTGLIKLGMKEAFIDCGAYKGDSIREFLKHLHKCKICSKDVIIIAFEPDKYNFRMLKKYVKKVNIGTIKCFRIGTWDEKTILRFCGNTEEGCKISDDGDTVIHTETIDSVAANLDITYIKMDVEGAEMKSLAGAEKVISRCHPRLAISIYHSDEDMVDIIEYIKEKYPFYKLYIRHYTYFYADTVLYAIDDKKNM